jgi:hypothetical protein
MYSHSACHNRLAASKAVQGYKQELVCQLDEVSILCLKKRSTPAFGSKRTSIASRRKRPTGERRRHPSGWTCCDRYCMCESGQRVLPISNAQAIVGAIDVISVAIRVVDLVDDLSAFFRPQTEPFDCNAVD